MNITAAQIIALGKPLQIRNVSLPKLKPREIQVKIHFSGINFYETMLIDGKYPTTTSLPCTIGGELSGEVIAVGKKVKAFKRGDRVFSFAQTGKGTTGSYATFANVEEKYVYRLPEFLTYEQGAAFPMVFFAAYTMLSKKLSIHEKSTILVHSGSGGVGGTLIQLIKALYPRTTILSTYSQESKQKILKALGADITIQSTRKDFVSLIQRYIPDGFDIIFDPVGQALFDVHITLLKPLTGVLCSYGTYSGPIQDPNVVAKLRAKNLALVGFLMWPLIENKQWCNSLFEEIIKTMETCSFVPRVDKIFPLLKVQDAFKYIKERKNTGKVLLSCLNGVKYDHGIV